MEKEYSEKFYILISPSMEFFPSHSPPVSLHRQALLYVPHKAKKDLEKWKRGDIPNVIDGKQGVYEQIAWVS